MITTCLASAYPSMESLAKLENRWRTSLVLPEWYFRLESDIRRYILRPPENDCDRRRRWKIYDLVAEALEHGILGRVGSELNCDTERQSIRFAVLHHSGTLPDVSISRLSAMGLLRLYVPATLNRANGPDQIDGQIRSGHSRNGQELFHAYHWIVRTDGRAERLLPDSAIGWHSGNWEINCSSVGICLAGDYSAVPPTLEMLTAIGELLTLYSSCELVLHSSVNASTNCPGSWANTFVANMTPFAATQRQCVVRPSVVNRPFNSIID